MNKNSNRYIVLYATVMVILVAVGLAFTSQVLKERKKNNANIDQMRQVLRSLHINVTADKAIQKYQETITDAFLVDKSGNIIEGTQGTDVNDPAFGVSLRSIPTGQEFPVFVANVDGARKYILGMYGAGLWGPIWGYLSVNEDGNTIFGAEMSHASETPALGAEIATPRFTEQFIKKELFKEGTFKSIAVVKPGRRAEGQDFVDGIAGGTLTSKGVHNMLWDCISQYEAFLANLNK